MNYRLRISPAADADVDEAALFIAQDNLDAALRFTTPLKRRTRRFATTRLDGLFMKMTFHGSLL